MDQGSSPGAAHAQAVARLHRSHRGHPWTRHRRQRRDVQRRQHRAGRSAPVRRGGPGGAHRRLRAGIAALSRVRRGAGILPTVQGSLPAARGRLHLQFLHLHAPGGRPGRADPDVLAHQLPLFRPGGPADFWAGCPSPRTARTPSSSATGSGPPGSAAIRRSSAAPATSRLRRGPSSGSWDPTSSSPTTVPCSGSPARSAPGP